MSLLLDIFAAILSGGRSTHQIESCITEYSVSQVFIAISLKSLYNFPSIGNSINLIINDLHNSNPIDQSVKIRYPGESVLKLRKENTEKGIPVNKNIWEKLLAL